MRVASVFASVDVGAELTGDRKQKGDGLLVADVAAKACGQKKVGPFVPVDASAAVEGEQASGLDDVRARAGGHLVSAARGAGQ